MALLGLLSPLVSLLYLVSFIWLVVVGFKRSVGWGLGMLFLTPFAPVIFAIKYWEESKKPFLMWAGSIAGFFVVIILSFATMGGFEVIEMARQAESGELENEQMLDFIEGQMDRVEGSGQLTAQDREELQRMRSMFDDMRQDADPHRADGGEGDRGRPAIVPAIAGGAPDGGTVAIAPDDWDPFGDDPALVADAIRAPAGLTPVPFHKADRIVGKIVRIVGTDGRVHRGRLSRADRRALLLERHLSSGTVSYELGAADVRSVQVLYP